MNFKNLQTMTTKVMVDFVMVEPIEQTTQTKGGLLLSEQDRKEIGVEKAKIVSVGPLCTQEIKVGDIAIYNADRVDSVDVDGEIYRVLPEHSIILIQTEDV